MEASLSYGHIFPFCFSYYYLKIKKVYLIAKISLEFLIALFGKGSFGESPGLQQIIIVLIPS
jgi:hypothetical protein